MSTQRRMACNKGCGILIHFDDSHVSQSGKKIPLEDDNEPHQCPNSNYQQQQQKGQGQRSNSISNLDEIDAKLDKVLEFVVEINNKLMKQETLE
jgi:hypothetical protein